MIRQDLRNNHQYRELCSELGLISEADGSCKFSTGRTVVQVSIYGPNQPKYSRHEEYDKLTVEIEFNDPTTNKLPDASLQKFIMTCLNKAICLSNFPRMVLLVKVYIIFNGGSLLSTVLHACNLALIDAGVPLNFLMVRNPYISILFSSVCYYQVCISGIISPDARHDILLDPTSEEEKSAEARFNIAYGQISNSNQIIATYNTGRFRLQQLANFDDVSSRNCLHFLSFMRSTIENSRKHNPMLLIT